MVSNNSYLNPRERYKALNIFDRYPGLPDLSDLDLFGTAIGYACDQIKAPDSMILLTALSAIATVNQALCDVERPSGGKTSLSFYGLLIAFSGERKSSMINFFYKLIREAEIEAEAEFQAEHALWKRKHQIWKMKRTVFTSLLRKTVQAELAAELSEANYNDDNILKAQNLVDAHLIAEPAKPRKPQLLHEDTTYPALLQAAHENSKYLCVLADEGSRTLDGLVTPGISALNSAWNGVRLITGRKTSESFTVNDPRFSMLISIQPGPFDDYRERKSDQAKESGLWARAFVCSPHSTIGYRDNSLQICSERPDKFEKRLRKLVKKCMKKAKGDNNDRNLMRFDDTAEELFHDISREIELNMRPGGLYENAKDHASKLMENIARIAANLHIINNYDGNISWKTLNTAIHICVFFSKEYLNVFDSRPQHIIDAELLFTWITTQAQNCNSNILQKRWVMQHCPSKLRKAKRFWAALEHLEMNQSVRVFIDVNKTHFIEIIAYPRQS
jgi:hypothetical protein